MCQLTMINLPYRVAKLALFNQLLINTISTHQDGFGYYQKDNSIYKWKEKPADVHDLDDVIINTITNNNPIIAHVRLATSKLSVAIENSHPFETDKLVLAHNGTLTPKNKEEMKAKYKEEIDSEIFLKELDEVYKGKDIVKALNKTMDKFTGPFAFLIYSKLEDKYFVVRGTTKSIYISYVYYNKIRVGFIINTDKLDLIKNLSRIYVESKFLTDITVTYDAPELVPLESVCVIKNNKLKQIGAIKENDPIVAVVSNVASNVSSYTYNRDKTKEYSGYTYSTQLSQSRLLCEPITKFITAMELTLEELDLITYKLLGIPLLSLQVADITTLSTLVFPKIEKLYSATKSLHWADIVIKSNLPVLDVYLKYDIKFPYMFERTSKLIAVSQEINIDKKGEIIDSEIYPSF